ncbi:hypothetical protein G6539_20740, partial [Streptomyces albidoflavus]|nr:hypothetical protein [Streptomyces albidoflavus]
MSTDPAAAPADEDAPAPQAAAPEDAPPRSFLDTRPRRRPPPRDPATRPCHSEEGGRFLDALSRYLVRRLPGGRRDPHPRRTPPR